MDDVGEIAGVRAMTEKVSTSARDPRTGRFKKLWHLSQKGYPRFHTKPYRNRYVHIVKMELEYLGRELKKAEDVDHRNGNKLDWSKGNLRVLDHSVHGFVSNKQKWFVENVIELKRKREWEEYFGAGASEVLAMVEIQEYGEDVCFP